MHLHCFGTAGYHANEDRHTSSYYLPETGIALDAGSGFFRLGDLQLDNLQLGDHCASDTLDILITHAHLDHILGLTYLLGPALQEKFSSIHIWGELEKLQAIRENLFHPLLFPATIKPHWHNIQPGDCWEIRGVQIACRAQKHPGGSLAFRLDWPNGRRLVYATDTTGDTSEEHAEWSRHADLLIHECYFQNAQSQWAETTGHSWTSRVAEVVQASAPKKLLLTHLNPTGPSLPESELDEIRRWMSSELIVASDHLRVEF